MVQGPAIMLSNLLKIFPEKSYCILTKKIRWRGEIDPFSKLTCAYYFVGNTYRCYRTKLHNLFSQLLEQIWILRIVFKGLRVIKRERVDRILAFNNEGDLLIAAYVLHKITKLPFFLYMLDVYEEMTRMRLRKFMAVLFEEKIFRAAREIFVMSENLQTHYLRKYNLHTKFMPHPVVLSGYRGQIKKNNNGAEKTIIYTGNVWIPQSDGLADMCAVVNSMRGIKFIVYTDRSAEELKEKGVCGRNVVVRFIQHSHIAGIQQDADILYLPLAFNTPFPLMIQTASPGKMPEYLAAGKPMLIYAPPYAYITQHARKYQFGFVVDKRSAEELKMGIRTLLTDEKLRDKYVANAKKLSKQHDAVLVSRRLLSSLDTVASQLN